MSKKLVEQWKDIEGYEGRYQVSDLGRVKSLARFNGNYNQEERVLNPVLNRRGYLLVNLRKDNAQKGIYIHRLVAKAFNQNWYEGCQIDHKSGVKTDNSATNLDCVTNRENGLRIHRLNGKPRGARKLRPPYRAGRYRSQISVNNETIFLGNFDTKEEAQQAFFNKYLDVHGVHPW